MRKILELRIDYNRIYGLDMVINLLHEMAGRITDFFTFDGVSIFFVLSGFLIGGILIKIL